MQDLADGLVFPYLQSTFTLTTKPFHSLNWSKLSGRLPAPHNSEVDALRFSVSAEYRDEIKRLARLAQEEHGQRHFGVGSKIKNRLYSTCVDLVYNAFYALADCVWDRNKETWGHRHLQNLIASKMAYRFWVSQKGIMHKDAILYAYVNDLASIHVDIPDVTDFLKSVHEYDPFALPFAKSNTPMSSAAPKEGVPMKTHATRPVPEAAPEVSWGADGVLRNKCGLAVPKFNRFGHDAASGDAPITRKQPILRFPTVVSKHPVSICIKGHESGLPPKFIQRLKELDFTTAPIVKYKLYPKFGNKHDEVGAARVYDIDTQTIFFDCTHVNPPEEKTEEMSWRAYTFPACGAKTSMANAVTASDTQRALHQAFLSRLADYDAVSKRFTLRATPTDVEHRGTIEAPVHHRDVLVLDYSTVTWDVDAPWAGDAKIPPKKKRARKPTVAEVAAAVQKADEDPVGAVVVTSESVPLKSKGKMEIRFASAGGKEGVPSPGLGSYWKCDPCRVQVPMQDVIEERTGRACTWCAGQMILVRTHEPADSISAAFADAYEKHSKK
mgnify:CR=1 FL=1